MDARHILPERDFDKLFVVLCAHGDLDGFGAVFDFFHEEISPTVFWDAMSQAMIRSQWVIVHLLLSWQPTHEPYDWFQHLFPQICGKGDLMMVEWAWRRYKRFAFACHPTDRKTCLIESYASAVENEHFHVIEWLQKMTKKDNLRRCLHIGDILRLLTNVLESWNVKALQWLLDRELFSLERIELLNYGHWSAPFWDACREDKLHVAKWLYALAEECHCCHEVIGTQGTVVDLVETVCLCGSLEIIQWIYNVVLPGLGESSRSYVQTGLFNAMSPGRLVQGKLDVVKWFVETWNVKPRSFSTMCAARGDHVEVLQWMKENYADDALDYNVDMSMSFADACDAGNVKIAGWIYENYREDVVFDTCVLMLSVCRRDRFASVRFLMMVGDQEKMDEALEGAFKQCASSGMYSMCRFLYELSPHVCSCVHPRATCQRKLKLDWYTYVRAIADGDLDFLRWMKYVQLGVDKFVSEAGDEYENTELYPILEASKEGDLRIVKWLYSWLPETKRDLTKTPTLFCHGQPHEIFRQACVEGHVELAVWLANLYPDVYVVKVVCDGSCAKLFSYSIKKKIEYESTPISMPAVDVVCPVCLTTGVDGTTEFVQSHCKHLFCRNCVQKMHSMDDQKPCPCCRKSFLDFQFKSVSCVS